MLRNVLKKLARLAFWGALALLILILGPRALTGLVTLNRIHPADQVSPQPVAIVFGAGLRRDGGPSAVLRDRVRTAAELYFEGKVRMLLLSGDNSDPAYDEPTAMYEYARSLGVPDAALVRDYAGRRTYDTCYRADAIFQVQGAILVTQAYHLPRAVYTCNALGLPSQGVPAQESRYWQGALTFWKMRELGATMVALWEIHITQPLPILGEPEPISMEAR
jgi:vancomycin permeability regulator SanA